MCFAEVSTVPLVYCHGKFHWNCFAIAQELRWFGEKIAPPGRDSSHVFVFFKGPIHPLTLLWVVSCTNQFSSYVWSLQIYRIYIYVYIHSTYKNIWWCPTTRYHHVQKKRRLSLLMSIHSRAVPVPKYRNTAPWKNGGFKDVKWLELLFSWESMGLISWGGLAFKGYLPLDSHDVCFDMFLLLEI